MSTERLRRYAVYIAGLALLLAMDRPPVFAFLLASATPQTQAARAIADLSLAVGGVALCAASHRFPALLKAKRPLALVGGLLASASSLVTALVAHAHLIAPQALITVSVAFSVGHLLLIASWFLASRALPSRRLLPAALVAFALSMVLVVIDFLPATCHLAVVIALPLACAVLACLTRSTPRGLCPHQSRSRHRRAARPGLHGEARGRGADAFCEHRAKLHEDDLSQDGRPQERRAYREDRRAALDAKREGS